MKIEELKSYEEVHKYAETVGYKNLTDEDIERLCKKVLDICKHIIEEHKKKNFDPKFSCGIKLMEYSFANNICYHLRHCTPERERAIRQDIEKALEIVNHKEALARESLENKILGKSL